VCVCIFVFCRYFCYYWMDNKNSVDDNYCSCNFAYFF
jgi:hypothetical protein